MRQALFLVLKIAVLVALAVWIAERPGQVEVAWQGYIVETSVGVLVAAVGLLALAAALLYRLWRWLVRAPAELGRDRARARRQRGYRALTNGMVAVAAGDPEAAQRYARRADILLNEPPLTMLLSAQAAQLNGDDQAARRYFEAMLERHETAFLGLRGLLNQALRAGDWPAALTLAERARAMRPNTPWLLATAFDLEVRLARWNAAEATLARAARAGGIAAEAARQHHAAILVERSRQAEAAGNRTLALELVQRAVEQAPAAAPVRAPALAHEARLLAADGREGRAARIVEHAWAEAPQRPLVAAWQALGGAAEDPLERVRRAERLAKLKPDDPESLLLQAETELAAKLWGAARNHLLKVEQLAPSRRVYRLLAELETAESNDTRAARDWLVKAEQAPAEPGWICAECGTVAPDWTALCPQCGAFDTLAWRVPTVALHRPHPPVPARLPVPLPEAGPP